jgi:hypothetical protein
MAAVLRVIAKRLRIRVVPPSAMVVGRAVEFLGPDIQMVQADLAELGKIARSDPDRETAFVDRFHCDIADAQIDHYKAVLVRIKAVRLGMTAWLNTTAWLELAQATRMTPRNLVDVAYADNVWVENIFPGTLAGVAAEIENNIVAVDGLAYRTFSSTRRYVLIPPTAPS